MWLSTNMVGSGVTITNVTDVTTNTTIAPGPGNIYQVGTLNSNQTRKFKLTGTWTKCTIDSFRVISGWNCEGYPTSLNDYTALPCDQLL